MKIYDRLPNGITIIDYHDGLASTLADMWNESEESWGGFDEPYTERKVLDEASNSRDLHAYVAMDGDKAVGYCGFSNYNNDTKALYVRLLNAHPDYKGKGVGKALVLQCVKRTIELGYPRLDIHTWPGNTDAVPLYKKCGYLFENRTESTHLVNFIPTVLDTPLFAPFFEKADWYADSTRELNFDPDGVKVNGFELFGYTWAKDGDTLAVGFERTGRQIRLIETNDYRIEMLASGQELAYGLNHTCQFTLTNKSGKPLSVQIQGEHQDNIQADFAFDQVVTDTMNWSADFFVGAVDAVQDSFTVHPCVMAQVTINGQTVPMGLGISAKPAVQMALSSTIKLPRVGAPYTSYLNLTNNLDKPCTLTFTLPGNERTGFEQATHTVELPALGKTSVPVTTTTLSMGHQLLAVPCELSVDADTTFNVSAKLHLINRDLTHSFAYQDDDAYRFVCGPWQLHLFKHYMHQYYIHKSELTLDHVLHGEFSNMALSQPVLGKPYSDETDHLTPTVNHSYDAAGINLTIAYDSQARPGVTVTRHVRMTNAGLLTVHYTLVNNGDKAQTVSVQSVATLPLGRTTQYGIDGEIYYIADKINAGLEDIDRERFEAKGENWLFESTPRLPLGTFGCNWGNAPSPTAKWGITLSFNQDVPELAVGESYVSEPLELAFGLFKTAEQYRDYVLQRDDSEQITRHPNISVQVNDGNPVVAPNATNISVQLMNERSQSAAGELVITSEPAFVTPQTLAVHKRSADEEEGEKENAEATATKGQANPMTTLALVTPTDVLARKVTKGLGLLDTQLNLSYSHEAYPRALLFPKGQVSQTVDGTVYTVDNGIIRFKADGNFGSPLFSLFNHDTNCDWLFSNYPESGPHAWWNPFFGGITTRPEKSSMRDQGLEQHTADFVTATDSMGNQWQGISVAMTYANMPALKGITWVSYFVTLPGVPVLACFSECINNTGHHQSLKTEQLMFPRDVVGIKAKCANGKQHHLRLGSNSVWLTLDGFAQLENATGHYMQVVSPCKPSQTFIDSDNKSSNLYHVNSISLANGGQTFIKPVFYVLSDTELPAVAFEDLAKLTFAAS